MSVHHFQCNTNKLPTDEGYNSRSPSMMMDPAKNKQAPSIQSSMKEKSAMQPSPLPSVSSIGFAPRPSSVHRSTILGLSLRHVRPPSWPAPVAVPKSSGHLEQDIESGAMNLPSWTAYSPVPEPIVDSAPKDHIANTEGDDEVDQLEDDVMDEADFDHIHQPSDRDTSQATAIVIPSSSAVSTTSTIKSHPTAPEPANIRPRSHSHAKHSIPTPHKSRVMRSLNSLGTKLAAEWAEAIDNYVDVLTQSAAKANAPKAKKLLLKAKWAMGNMYEARYNVRADVVMDSGAAAAVTGFSDLRTQADWGRDAIALWERAVELAECWRHRFLPNDEL